MSDSNGFRRVIDKLSQRRDQSTAQIRDEYLRLDETSRGDFREWVDKIVSAGSVPVGLGLNLTLSVHMVVRGADEPERIAVSPQTLAKAMAEWDRGEGYVHRALEF